MKDELALLTNQNNELKSISIYISHDGIILISVSKDGIFPFTHFHVRWRNYVPFPYAYPNASVSFWFLLQSLN